MVLLLAGAGCLQPLRLETANRVVVDMPPTSDAGGVVPMTVGGSPGPGCREAVAVIDVDGILVDRNVTGPYSLGENPLALFRERLDAAGVDPCVRAMVLRINSPGGGVTASDIMWRELVAFRERTGKPVVACLMSVGTGGAYYLATGADLIVAHPTTVTGGIGVILNLYNLRELMGQFNVLPQPVKAGEHIDMGTSARNLTPEAKELFQAMADEFHSRFHEVVVRRRLGVNAADGTTFGGRVFTARQALERGLVDQVGYLEDAIGLASGLASARVVMLHRGNDPARSLYAVTPNVPLHAAGGLVPASIPGLERSRLPTFLYLWQPEATLERLGGM